MSGTNKLVQSLNAMKNEGEEKLAQDLKNANEVAAKEMDKKEKKDKKK